MDYKRKEEKNKKPFFILFLFLGVLFLAILSARQKEKRVLFVATSENSVHLVNFDFPQKELLIIDIPKNTQVDVSYNLGQWELGSVWKLGEQEKVGGGRLLVDTVRKNFFVPVYLWTAPRDRIFVDGGFLYKLKYFVFPQKTNIGLFLRTRLALSSIFGRMNINRIALSDTGMLEETMLKTGKSGFLVSGDLPINLLPYFKEPLLEDASILVSIINESGNSVVVAKMGKVIDSMGARLVSVENQNSSEVDCLVYSKDKNTALLFASVFGCSKDKSASFSLEKNEVVIKIGKKFLSRW